MKAVPPAIDTCAASFNRAWCELHRAAIRVTFSVYSTVNVTRIEAEPYEDAMRLSISAAPRLFSGSFRFPHFGD